VTKNRGSLTVRLRSSCSPLAIGLCAGLVAACGGGSGDDGGGDGDDSDAGADAGPGNPGADAGNVQCGELEATIRDFNRSHVDFEEDEQFGRTPTIGLVAATLGPDRKPVFVRGGPAGEPLPDNSEVQITSAASFSDWYNDRAGVNSVVTIGLPLFQQAGTGLFVFEDLTFFPIDGAGLNEQSTVNEGTPPVAVSHNFHFTTEVHTTFVFKGGQTFRFIGDDDLWLFIDNKLVIDLGGLHRPADGTVDIGQLGLTAGQTYAMDIFHAERHTDRSTFRIETSIDCFGPVD
jgi:fibro-slime domain-containing protein